MGLLKLLPDLDLCHHQQYKRKVLQMHRVIFYIEAEGRNEQMYNFINIRVTSLTNKPPAHDVSPSACDLFELHANMFSY